jgi:FMN phosphatase YigB (HAD superfamily)
MVKAILFDFGGTLDTDGIHWSEKFWEKYLQFNVPVSKKDYEAAYVYTENIIGELISRSDDQRITLTKQVKQQLIYLDNQKILQTNNIQADAEQIALSCCEDVLKNVAFIKNLLSHLSKYYNLGIVSNYYGNLLTVLKSLQLDKYFDIVVDSAIAGIRKPDPGIFSYALRKLGLDPSGVIVVGDSYSNDIRPAKAAGCNTVWVDGKSWSRPENTRDADITIHSIVKNMFLLI